MRKLLVVLVAAVTLALGSAGTASAQGRNEAAPNCERGLTTALAASENRSPVAQARLTANAARCAGETETPV
jgi:hypothetical protein